MLRRLTLLFCVTLFPLLISAKHRILSPEIKTLQALVNDDWTGQPVMQLGSSDILYIDFDEMSHNYHRFVCHLEHCEPDWSPTEGLFESDWLQGFNDVPIDEYVNSINTTVLYTHYSYQLPNDQQRLKLSGNYRLHIIDEDCDGEEVAVVEFRVVEPLMQVGIGITTNTDIDLNQRHQQVAMTVNFNSVKVTNVDDQIQTFVMQNGREDNMKTNVRPNYITQKGLQWDHNKQLIFEAGNEYHKFEVLDPSHITMGLSYITWSEEQQRYHAFPYPCKPQPSYIYDQDADGAFYIRNSDNFENNRSSDYVIVHYQLGPVPYYPNANVVIDGAWTTEAPENYIMTYDEATETYHAAILQKLGYYNYQLLLTDFDGTTHRVPDEGSFFQTENRYQAFVYYKGTGERTWRLTGYQEVTFRH